MGLDMYLNRRYHIWSCNINPEDFTLTGNMPFNQHECKTLETANIHCITYEIGYWRKANHIHKWFVDNVQHNTDDCAEYTVDKNQLEDLLALCKKALQIKEANGLTQEQKEEQLEKLLPTQEGFFFGDTTYSDYYFETINDTIELLESEMQSKYWNDSNVDYTYQSSW